MKLLTMRASILTPFAFLAFGGTSGISAPTMHRAAAVAGAIPDDIVANDNRTPAGTLKDGVLTVHLEVRPGALHPEEDNGPSVPTLAFAEVGSPLRVPGPLIRVPQGTEIHVSIRNPFPDSTLTVHGLQDHDGIDAGPLVIPGGQTRETRFHATAEGTYYYWASTGKRDIDERDWYESQLTGAFIVDAPDARHDDRVFVIGVFSRPGDSTLRVPRPEQDVMVINGKTWPNTERFTFAQGDTVRWRWINPTTDSHPMHLHGFYYMIDSRGDWTGEKRYEGDAKPVVVTNLMLQGKTMRMHWVPVRAGNWIFHCHFAFHVSEHLILPRDGDGKDPGHSSISAHDAAPHRMSGLVLGIHVTPSGERRPVALTSNTPRRIRLVAQMKPRRFGKVTGFGYVTQEGAAEPARDSIRIPGPMLILKRGEPVHITVVNHLTEVTAVHWHGIELESFPDGVPGWSGSPGRIMPPIAPADSFVAEFVPPRAGTFIYHTHSNEQLQMGGGLYGVLLVVPPDKPYDPESDKVILVGGAGPADSLPDGQSPGLVNGSPSPAPIDLKVGKTYRLRLININPDWRVVFSLMSESAMATWRPVAVDGADLPMSQRVERPAWLLTGPGQTADFEITPAAAGDLRLEVKTYLAGWIIPVYLRVR